MAQLAADQVADGNQVLDAPEAAGACLGSLGLGVHPLHGAARQARVEAIEDAGIPSSSVHSVNLGDF